MKEHSFEFWLGVRVENEMIHATIYDSEEKQAGVLDIYKQAMPVLASLLRSAEDTDVLYLGLWTCPILPLFVTPYFDARVRTTAPTLMDACEKAILSLSNASRRFVGVRIFPGHCFGPIDGALHTPPGVVRSCAFHLESADIPIAPHLQIDWDGWTPVSDKGAKALMEVIVSVDPSPINENDGDRIMFDMLAKALGYPKEKWDAEWDSCAKKNKAVSNRYSQEMIRQGEAAITDQGRSTMTKEEMQEIFRKARKN
jgi:hypothetical protein